MIDIAAGLGRSWTGLVYLHEVPFKTHDDQTQRAHIITLDTIDTALGFFPYMYLQGWEIITLTLRLQIETPTLKHLDYRSTFPIRLEPLNLKSECRIVACVR